MGLLNTGLNALGTIAALKGSSRNSSAAASKFNAFQSELRRKPLARTNLWDVEIAMPKVIAGSSLGARLGLYAESGQLPGMFIQTDTLKPYGVGPQETVPYTMQTNDVTFTFWADGYGDLYRLFYLWMNRIVRGEEDIRTDNQSVMNMSPYEVEFKSEYATTINVRTYNEQGQSVIVYTLYDAFPKSIPDVSLSWSDSSNYMQFGITFAYTRAAWVNATTPLALTRNGFKGLSPLQKALKVGTALQTLKTIKKPSSIQDALASTTTLRNVTRAF